MKVVDFAFPTNRGFVTFSEFGFRIFGLRLYRVSHLVKLSDSATYVICVFTRFSESWSRELSLFRDSVLPRNHSSRSRSFFDIAQSVQIWIAAVRGFPVGAGFLDFVVSGILEFSSFRRSGVLGSMEVGHFSFLGLRRDLSCLAVPWLLSSGLVSP